MRRSFATLVLSLTVLLAGCSAGSQTTPGNTAASAAQTQATAPNTVAVDDPNPADPTEVDQLPAVSDAAHGRAPTVLRTAPGRKTAQSVLLTMEHEDVGFLTPVDGGGTIDGIEAIHTVYTADQVSLAPNGGPGTVLFAPTMHGPNGDCLEVGTWYFGSPVTAAFYVFDFCAAGGAAYVYSVPIDSVFESTYVATHNNLPAYRTETIFRNNKWHALLYNVQTSKWERLYSEPASSAGPQNGWSIEEYYFAAGNCPIGLPPFMADRIKYHNSATGTWDVAKNGSVDGLTLYEQPSAESEAVYGIPSCFVSPSSNSSGPPSDFIAFPDKRWNEWYTYGTGN
jgi:hypothetical protein